MVLRRSLNGWVTEDRHDGEEKGGDGVSIVSMNSDDDYCVPREKRQNNRKRGDRSRAEEGFSLMKPGLIERSPKIQLGLWLLEAGPSGGDWSRFDSMMVFSATENASELMIGSMGVDVAGFALHPNPADTYHAGSIQEVEAKGYPAPPVAKNSGGAIGVRYRPFGGNNDGGEYIWIAGAMVGRTSRAVCFLCVDLALHGPIQEDTVSKLKDIGVLDKFAQGDTGALRQEPEQYEPMVSPALVQARLDRLEFARAAQCNVVDEKTTLSPNVPIVTPPLQQRSLDIHIQGTWKGLHCEHKEASESGDFEYLDIASSVGDINEVSDFDEQSYVDEVDMLGRDLKQMDLDQEMVWATLIQGSRVL